MEWHHITKLSGVELYEKALAFKKTHDLDNYCIYMTMSANYDYKLAKEDLIDGYQLFRKQNHSKTKSFYEATQEYSHSVYYLGCMYCSGIGVIKDYNKAKELLEISELRFACFASLSSLALPVC